MGVDYNSIKEGTIKNPYHPSVCGKGYLGKGAYLSKVEGKLTKYYDSWKSMLSRCYDEKHRKKYPTYKDVNVCEEWHNFQNFAKWHEENYIEGYHLDKDVLVKGNKVYSPETCCFVPIEINSLFKNHRRGVNVRGTFKRYGKYNSSVNGKHLGYFNTLEEAFQAYKTAKEQHIKEVADKWKDKISEKVYQAMYNYKAEITD